MIQKHEFFKVLKVYINKTSVIEADAAQEKKTSTESEAYLLSAG